MGRQRLPAFDAGESPYYLRRYESTYVLSFLCGAAVMLGLSTLSGSNAESPHHVYELRLYHVKEGKMNALRDRFGSYTDAVFKPHNPHFVSRSACASQSHLHARNRHAAFADCGGTAFD